MDYVSRYLETKADIERLSDECVASGKDLILQGVRTDLDVELMMKYGLFPTKEFNLYFIDRLTMDEKSYKFWHSRSIHITNRRYQNNTTWYYSTLETHKRNAVKSATSLPLMYIAPNFVYKISKRPKTEMDTFRSPVSIQMERNKINNGLVNINGELWNCLPVTRYAEGMSKGMYHQDTNDENNSSSDFCGTFYYHEPESTTFLAYKTSRTFFNKTDALIRLGDELDDEFINPEFTMKELRMHMDGTLPADLMMTPMEYINLTTDPMNKLTRINEAMDVPNIPYYVGLQLNLYAAEDEHDQELCEAGKDANIDIIILTHMVGSHQVVTEILDTRDRLESFRSLIYTNI